VVTVPDPITPLRLRTFALRTARSVIATVITIAALSSIMAACSSSTTTTPSPISNSSGPTTAASKSATPSAVASSGSSISETCPAASVVNAALGEHASAPVSTTQPYGITCTYQGVGVPTKIQFQQDTVFTFTAGENAVAATLGTPTSVPGLGDQAYETLGFIAVLKGSISVKITAPLSSASEVEALAHQIVG
jgi:hypothetical protein